MEQDRAPAVQLHQPKLARQALTSYQVVIELIAATTTNTGLNVYARLDNTTYPQKIKITDEQIAAVNITGHQFHPEWNYRITPSVVHS